MGTCATPWRAETEKVSSMWPVAISPGGLQTLKQEGAMTTKPESTRCTECGGFLLSELTRCPSCEWAEKEALIIVVTQSMPSMQGVAEWLRIQDGLKGRNN